MDSMEKEDEPEKGPELGQLLCNGSDCSEAQLLYLLLEKKAGAGSSSATSSTRNEFIKEVHGNVDMHPVTLLTTLGVDLSGRKTLLGCYYFYSWTRYRDSKAPTRNRMTKDGLHCWLQGGGKNPIMKDEVGGSSQNTTIGFKRSFTFVGKPGQKITVSIKVGSQIYNFRLDEVVTDKDEEQEKRKLSEKQTPGSFLCIYRLKPNINKKHVQACGSENRGPHGQMPPSSLHSSHQTICGEQDLKVAQELSWPQTVHGEEDLKLAQDSFSAQTGRVEQGLKLAQESLSNDVQGLSECLPAEKISPEICAEYDSAELIYIPKHLQLYDQGCIGPFRKD